MKTKLFRFVAAASAASLLAGCVSTFNGVKPLSSGPPPKQRPEALVLGDIKMTDARWSEREQKVMLHAFQFGVEKWCAAHNSFELCKGSPRSNPRSEALVLNGAITEIQQGSSAARFWVGFGVGQQRARGEFVLNSADGTKLTAFRVRKSYLGGQGIG